MNKPLRKLNTRIRKSLITGMIAGISLVMFMSASEYVRLYNRYKVAVEELNYYKQEYLSLREVNKRLVRESHTVPSQPTTQEVVFTNYYTGDKTGSGKRTGSGLTTKDFMVNEKGWYTYEGFVVVATATNECINSTFGACKSYTGVPDGYHVFNYFDTLTITINGQRYPAIVLDSCGACFWNGDYQRVDIFVKNSQYSFGRKKGMITWE